MQEEKHISNGEFYGEAMERQSRKKAVWKPFCVTQRTFVTHGRKRKTSDNQLIITRLPRAENGTRTRDLNLGKVVLYQLSYFRNMFFGLRKGFHPSFRHPKLAFRDCKYKLKNLFCKIFRRILSQNDVPGLRKSRGHPYGKPLYPGGGMNRPAGNRGINEPGNLRRHAPGWAAGHKYHPGACCVRP